MLKVKAKITKRRYEYNQRIERIRNDAAEYIDTLGDTWSLLERYRLKTEKVMKDYAKRKDIRLCKSQGVKISVINNANVLVECRVEGCCNSTLSANLIVKDWWFCAEHDAHPHHMALQELWGVCERVGINEVDYPTPQSFGSGDKDVVDYIMCLACLRWLHAMMCEHMHKETGIDVAHRKINSFLKMDMSEKLLEGTRYVFVPWVEFASSIVAQASAKGSLMHPGLLLDLVWDEADPCLHDMYDMMLEDVDDNVSLEEEPRSDQESDADSEDLEFAVGASQKDYKSFKDNGGHFEKAKGWWKMLEDIEDMADSRGLDIPIKPFKHQLRNVYNNGDDKVFKRALLALCERPQFSSIKRLLGPS